MRLFMLIALLFFFGSNMAYGEALNPEDPSLEEKIHQKAEEILGLDKTIDRLGPEDLVLLPVGIVKNVGASRYVIIIDSVSFTPAGAFMNVYASIEVGESRLAFAATNILFQPEGLSADAGIRLELVSRHVIPFGENVELILPPDGSNYVEFDCNGYRSVNVRGIFEFSREVLIPADPGMDKVRAEIEGNFMDFDNIIASVSIDPFHPKKIQDLTISIERAYIDFSDVANPTAIIFPQDYNPPSLSPALWRGFYIERASVQLPKKLNSGSEEPMIIGAQNLIIDKQGISGFVGASNIISKESGNLGGWPFSIDTISISLVRNQLTHAIFHGEMVVPPFDKETPLKYGAIISSGIDDHTNYHFQLTMNDSLKASALMAQVKLLPGSTVSVSSVDGQLYPEAVLHGEISVKSGNKLDVQRLQFQNLHLATQRPFIRGGVWGLTGSGNEKMGSFPIAIENVRMIHAEDQMRLSLDVMLNFMDSQDQGFGASANVFVEAGIEEEQITEGEGSIPVRRWVHERTSISAAQINYQSTAWGLNGSVRFYDGLTSGRNGFRGELKAYFAGGKYMVDAIAEFGRTEEFRYWYVDAMMSFNPALGTGFGIYGIGGGLAYHMRRDDPTIVNPGDFANVTGSGDAELLGQTRSGTRFVPDINSGITFKAAVIVGTTAKAEVLNGLASFEMAFFRGGGVKYIRFLGEAYFMKKINEPIEVAKMYASLDVNLDFVNDELHGELAVFIRFGNVLRGSYSNGLAGRAIIHVDRNDWYIHVGNPQQRISVDILGAARVGAYFMAGTYIHDFPSPTEVMPGDLVADISDDLDNFMRDENALASGGGVAFGASLAISTGRQTLLIFYGQFDAGLGFDVMLRDYGSAHCAGETEPIGINGWYAAGQAYAGLMGEIGVYVDLKFIKGEFVIMQVGVGAILQAKLPNPAILYGYLTGQYNILGGLVKGRFNFKMRIGEECEIVGASSVGVKVIAEMKPSEDEEVDVFAVPQVAFNVPVNEVFELPDDASGNPRKYKVQMDYFEVFTDQEKIAGEIEYNQDNKVIIFNSFDILPPNSSLTARVKVTWYHFSEGAWRPLGGSTPEYEDEEVHFFTGEAPDYIPESNVALSYPAKGMRHLHVDESRQGFIRLKRGQPYLFDSQNDFDFVIDYSAVQGQSAGSLPVFYDQGERTVNFNLPTSLSTKTVYEASIIKIPKSETAMDENVVAVERVVASTGDNEVVVETQDIEGTLEIVEEQVLYNTFFATSRYRDFSSKFNSFGQGFASSAFYDYSSYRIPAIRYQPDEAFDEYEVEGGYGERPYLQFEVQNNEWFNYYVKPLLYDPYPFSLSNPIEWRDKEPYGIPPLKAIAVDQSNPTDILRPDDLSEYTAANQGNVYFLYDFIFFITQDYAEIQRKLIDKYISSSSLPSMQEYLVMSNLLRSLNAGVYEVDLYYNLPAKDRRYIETLKFVYE